MNIKKIDIITKKLQGLKMKKLSIIGLLAISAFAGQIDCTACHNGGYQEKLNNLTPKEIVKKMHEFKNSTGTMANIAKTMTDKEIEKVAKEYGKQ